MEHIKHPNQANRPRRLHVTIIAVAVAILTVWVTDSVAAGEMTETKHENAASTVLAHCAGDDLSPAEVQARQLAEKWGVEITSIRLTASDHMIDYRYRVLDPVKAAALFQRNVHPSLIHQSSGKVLSVPNTAKVGPLRNSNTPQKGRIYWMFFGNAGQLVKAGDKVTVRIGEFQAENLIVD